jgi:hypothetical protein
MKPTPIQPENTVVFTSTQQFFASNFSSVLIASQEEKQSIKYEDYKLYKAPINEVLSEKQKLGANLSLALQGNNFSPFKRGEVEKTQNALQQSARMYEKDKTPDNETALRKAVVDAYLIIEKRNNHIGGM